MAETGAGWWGLERLSPQGRETRPIGSARKGGGGHGHISNRGIASGWVASRLLPILPEAEVSKDNDGQGFRQTQDGRLEGVTT